MKRALAVAAVAVLLAGCFPVTLSVAPDGRIALAREEGIVVYDLAKNQANLYPAPEEGVRAAWAMFSRDGKRLLYAMEKENGPGTLYICDGVGGAGKKLYTSDNPMIWALWAPDGKHVSVGEISQQSKGDLGNLVTIKSVAVDTGAAVTVAEDTLPSHDWTADSASIVAIVVKKKVGDKDKAFAGTLTQFALDGKATPLAEIIAAQEATLDVTPDGKDVLLTVSAAGKPGTELEPPANPAWNCLFACSIDKKEPAKLSDSAMACAFYSPDGRHVAALRIGDKTDLVVLDRDGKNLKVLATGAVNTSEGFDSARFLPVWASNDTVIFWKNRVVVGTAGKAITTMSVKIDGAAPVNLQPKLDLLAEKAK